MTRLAALVLVLAAGTAHAEPTAAERYEIGKALFAKGEYAKAANEFAAAHALEPQPMYLYNVAQAERMAGRCAEAIAAYREFLAGNPPKERAAVARVGLEKCEAAVRTDTPPDKPPVDPPNELIEPVVPPPKPLETKAITVRERAPWYKDPLGDALVGTGGVLLIASTVFYFQARTAANETHDGGTLDDFEAARQRAVDRRGLAVIGGGIGLALVAGGLVRYALRPSHERVVIVPAASDGAVGLGVGGRF